MMKRIALLSVALFVTACGAAQMAGASANMDQKVAVENKSKAKVCTVDSIYSGGAIGKGETKTQKTDIGPGETKDVSLSLPIGQDRTFRLKGCDGVMLKEVSMRYDDANKHPSIALE